MVVEYPSGHTARRRIGVVRSMDGIDALEQCRTLTTHGCDQIRSLRDHPNAGAMVADADAGDVIVVTRFDGLVRSAADLASVIGTLEARGASLRSLDDGFDSATPQGRAMLAMLSSIVELERGILRKRTREGMEAARRRGAAFGNPEMLRGDRDAVMRMRAAQSDAYTRRARLRCAAWLPLVQLHRPSASWETMLRLVHEHHPDTRSSLTIGSMVRDVRRLVAAGDLPRTVTDRAPTGRTDPADAARRILAARPDASLRTVARDLDILGLRPPRAATWSPQAVSRLVGDAA
jgi:hypothetical protein